MAFNQQSWGIISGAANNKIVTLQSGSSVGAPNICTYVSLTDTLATITTANYFNPVVVDLNLGDFIYAVGTDGADILSVATLTVSPPAITVTFSAASGNVQGPASATNNDFALFSGTTGKLIKDAGFSVVPLASGGSNAALTASNGGIIYSSATAMAVLAGTATAGQILRSGATAAPTWSTATYPATTTVSQLLYSSSTNVVAGLATGNNGVLVTGNTGIPSISSTLPAATQDNITRLGAIAALNVSTALIADASKNITSSAVTSTELGYVGGVTSAIQTQFTGKISQSCSQVYAADSGLADAYVVTLSPVPGSLVAGQVVNFLALHANTTAATLDLNSLGAKAIKKKVTTDLAANDILAGQLVTVVYDGTNFQMTSLLGN